jgi:glycine cleavage system H protein
MSTAHEVRTDRFYTAEHEWAKSSETEVLIGISAFAVDQLGDVTLVDLSVQPGDTLNHHQVLGTIESVKTLSDIFAPIAGRVTRVNTELCNHPEWVNEDCWEKAWMIAIQPTNAEGGSAGLLDPVAYGHLLEESSH